MGFLNEDQQKAPGVLETPAGEGARAIEDPNELPPRPWLNSYAYKCISMHALRLRVNYFYYQVVIIFALHETPAAQRDPRIGSFGRDYQPGRSYARLEVA